MVVFENIFGCVLERKFCLNFKKNLKDSHYKAIYRSVKSEYSSRRVQK